MGVMNEHGEENYTKGKAEARNVMVWKQGKEAEEEEDKRKIYIKRNGQKGKEDQ